MTKPNPQHQQQEIALEYGWFLDPIKGVYRCGEFRVTKDIIENAMKNWGRKIEKIHLFSVLERLRREFTFINNHDKT